MPNKVPLNLTEEEIQRRCDEIQANWTDAVREQRRRGNQAEGANAQAGQVAKTSQQGR